MMGLPADPAGSRCALNDGSGAWRPVPAAKAERPFCIQWGDLRWKMRQRARCADSGPSHHYLEVQPELVIHSARGLPRFMTRCPRKPLRRRRRRPAFCEKVPVRGGNQDQRAS